MIATLQELKDYLEITGTDEDAVLTSLLQSADSFVKNYIGRDIEAQDYDEKYDGKAERQFILNQYPVNSLTSFEYNVGTLGNPVWKGFDQNYYAVEEKTGIIETNFYLPRGLKNIKVVYNAGYDPVPADLKQAVIELASIQYNKKGADGISSEKVDDAALTYDKTKVPEYIFITLDLYKNV